MNVDPDYEFECPKWFDFNQDDGEPQECLDNSWFERDHPLHEPKDKEKSFRDLKPLIDINQKQPIGNRKTMASKTEGNSKYKKSLGVKRSVRLMRGDHGPAGKRKLPEVTTLKHRYSSEGLKDNKETRSGCQDEKSSRDDFSVGNNLPDFTPPWGYSSPSTRTVSSEETDISPKTALLPLHGPLMSPPINSPKNTLLSKAINKAAATGRKRRILPSIPCPNQEISSHLPLRGTSPSDVQSPTYSAKESCAKSPVKNASSDKQLFDPKRHNLDSSSDNIMDGQKQGMDETSNGNLKKDCPVSVEDLLKLHNQKVFASKSKYDSNGRRIQRRSVVSTASSEEPCTTGGPIKRNSGENNAEDCLKEEETSDNPIMDNLDIINTERNVVNPISKPEESKNDNQEMTAEDLLKLHNQRIMASKSKYDCNGRRIRTANPSFCAAPSKSDVPEKASVTKSKGRRSAACTTTVGTKRLSSCSTDSEANARLKQQRRSCVAAPKSHETICGPSKINVNENSRKSSASTEASPQNLTFKTSTSNMKRNAVTQDAKSGQKNKRRSCVATPASSLQSAGTSKVTGLAAQNRRNRRSCVAAPKTSRTLSDSVDEELKDLIARHNQRLANSK